MSTYFMVRIVFANDRPKFDKIILAFLWGGGGGGGLHPNQITEWTWIQQCGYIVTDATCSVWHVVK